MKLGLNGATTLKADLTTDIAVAGRAGFDFVEIWAAKLIDYLEGGGLPALRRDLKRAGVTAATLNSVEHVTFNDPSGHVRMLEDFERFCRVAEAIACETVLVVPSPRPKGVSMAAIEQDSVKVLRELSGIAKPYGVRLAYEFLGFADCTAYPLSALRPRCRWHLLWRRLWGSSDLRLPPSLHTGPRARMSPLRAPSSEAHPPQAEVCSPGNCR